MVTIYVLSNVKLAPMGGWGNSYQYRSQEEQETFFSCEIIETIVKGEQEGIK